jgi:hypothetical protein
VAVRAGPHAVAGVAVPSGAPWPAGVTCHARSVAPAASATPLAPRPVAASSVVPLTFAHTGGEKEATKPPPAYWLGHATQMRLVPIRKFRVMLNLRTEL